MSGQVQQNTLFYITPQRPIEVSENRKKLQEISNQYWKENVKTRFVGDKLVFPNGHTYKEKVVKPTPGNVLMLDQVEKETLQKIQISALETSAEENIFKIAAATTETYNHARNLYKKVIIDPAYSTADHNILDSKTKTDSFTRGITMTVNSGPGDDSSKYFRTWMLQT